MPDVFQKNPGHLSVLPFGLHGVSATLQRLVDKDLSGVSDFALAYLHDIDIQSNTWEEHLKRLQVVSSVSTLQDLPSTLPSDPLPKQRRSISATLLERELIKPQI